MIKNFDYLDDLRSIKKKINKSFNSVLNSGNLILGRQVEEFEKNFSKFLGVKYGLGVGNCTDAIYISLKALNIGINDEVITVANTAIPTITAIVNSGATPRFVDVGDDYLIDPSKIIKQINKKTKAIIPVHLYGNLCDMKKICKIAQKYNLKIIEDCAQSTGSMSHNKKSGSFGDTGCFSFYPTKILGGFGDGGFISTNNKKLYKKLKRIRFMGIQVHSKKKLYTAIEQGTNSRLDELQAALLNVKLKKIKNYIKIRQSNAKKYYNFLKDTDLILPKNERSKHVFYEYVVRSKKRNNILKSLKKIIKLKITYPVPIHKMKPYKQYNQINNKLTNTENYSKQIFSLPVYPGIKKEEILKIGQSIKKVLKKN